MKIKNKNYAQEFLFILSLFYHDIIRIPLYYFSGLSKVIIAAVGLIIILASLFYQFNLEKRIIIKSRYVFFVLFIVNIFIFNMFFLYNSIQFSYLKDFIWYGAVPMYLATLIKDYKQVLYYGALMSSIFIVIYMFCPFNNYIFFSGYMEFGMYLMLPGFLFTYIYRKYFNNKKFFIFEIIALVEMIIFCNRGSLLSACTCLILLELFVGHKDIKSFIKYLLIIFALYFIYQNLYSILTYFYNFFKSIGYKSYSLYTYIKTMDGKINGMSHRDVIWDAAYYYFSKNQVFGYGIGAFHSYYGIYTHNIFWEILTSFGIFGFIIAIIIIMKKIINIFKCKNYEEKIISIFFLVLGIGPLLFSLYMASWPFFWSMLILNIKYLGVDDSHEQNVKVIKGKNFRS